MDLVLQSTFGPPPGTYIEPASFILLFVTVTLSASRFFSAQTQEISYG